MFVSGSLMDKTVAFYKEGIHDFDKDGMNTEKCYISYNGELVFSPWDNIERKLILNQEKHMDKIEENIFNIFPSKGNGSNKYTFYTDEIKKIIGIIRCSDRRISFALMQALYTNLINSRDIMKTLYDFCDLIKYLDSIVFNVEQTDIDAILNLFTNNKSYDEDSVSKYKLKRYGIDKESIDSQETLALYKYGEFAAPNRLAKVGKFLESEYSEYVLPIYFSINSDKKAEKFLSLCRNSELDRDMAIDNAEKLNVPENIICLIKK